MNLGDVECDDGNKFDGDGCNKECKVENGYKCYSDNSGPDKCIDIQPPQAELSLVNGRILVLNFDEIVLSKVNSTLLSKSMKVTLEGAKQGCEFIWYLSNSFPACKSFNNLTIQTYPNCSLSANAQIFIIRFTNPNHITDLSGNQMTTSTYIVRSKKYTYIPASQENALNGAGSAFDSSSTITFIIMIGVSMFQSVAIGSFWSFVNMVQMLSYLPVMNLQMPLILQKFLCEYLTVKKVAIPFDLLPLSYNPLRVVIVFLSKPINEKFLMAGYETISFIFNFADELLTWISLFFVYIFLRIVCCIIPNDSYFIILLIVYYRCSFIHKWKSDFEYNAVIRILIESFLNLTFCSMLNMWHVFYKSQYHV